MKAILLFKEKRVVRHRAIDSCAVVEIRIWQVGLCPEYPAGLKYSLFLIQENQVLLGIDNHRPKGPHLHRGSEEYEINLYTADTVLDCFWALVIEQGFVP